MASQNNLEIKGNLQSHPFAELFLEAAEANLHGSFRLSSEANKAIVYLKDGNVVFAVSNARRHRLFEILLHRNKISQNQLSEIPNFAGDLELAENLKNKLILSEDEYKEVFSTQIKDIISEVFSWNDGEWIFSPLARIKESINFEIDPSDLLLNYARNLPEENLIKRFKSPQEAFGSKPFISKNIALLPQEAFVLSRFEKSFLHVQEIKTISGLPGNATLRTLYTLWLGGLLFRQNWQAAFSERKISEILSAKLSLKKAAEATIKTSEEVKSPLIPIIPSPPVPLVETPKKDEISLDNYLRQVENATNIYEVLNISQDAELKEIKPRYFALAKQFHPDIFHQEKDSVLLQRIQNAFALTAQAYDVLKDPESRQVYDYKLNKTLLFQKSKTEAGEKSEKSGNLQLDSAKESFDHGFTLLVEEEYEEAIPFLARAVQLAPDNAKYHAYYGKSLISDESQRYKADTELQAAIRLEPKNVTYRLMAAEFYIHFKLHKRAEGELNRLLSISPNNSDALNLLATLSKK